jgi:hypothetical protein
MIALGIIIISYAEYRIGVIIASLLYASFFIILYQTDNPQFYKPLMITLLCVVLLILSLSISYSRENRIVV